MHLYKRLKGNGATRRVKWGWGRVLKGIQGELTNIKHILRKGHMKIY